MIPVSVTITPHEKTATPAQVIGYAPSDASPLAVTRHLYWDKAEREWFLWEEGDGYCITHRPTGLNLGPGDGKGLRNGKPGIWYSLADAWSVLLRCEPDAPEWSVAGTDERAREACRARFMRACNG